MARVLHQTAFGGSSTNASSRLSPEVITTSGYIHKTLEFEISVFRHICELTKEIEHRLPILQLYNQQLGLNTWCLSLTMSLDPSIVTIFRVGFTWIASDLPQVHFPATVRYQRRGQRRHLYKYIHTYVHACTYIYIYIFMCMYIYMCIGVCTIRAVMVANTLPLLYQLAFK